MFGFFKRRKPITMDLNNGTIEAMFDEANSPEKLDYERISEHTSDLLDTLRVDVKHRKFVWRDGAMLSIAQLTQHIHDANPSIPVDTIDAWRDPLAPERPLPRGDLRGANGEKLQAQIEP